MLLTAQCDGQVYETRTPFEKNPFSDIVSDPDATFGYSFRNSDNTASACGQPLSELAAQVSILIAAQLTAAQKTDPFDPGCSMFPTSSYFYTVTLFSLY